MKLQPGERLAGAELASRGSDAAAAAKRRNAAVYVVEETIAETPWYGLYRARKIFRNARGDGKAIEEADENERLRVLLKTIAYTRLDDREYVKARRERTRFEAKRVLGFGKTNLLPEPLDVLAVRNVHDAFAFSRPGPISLTEPILVFENVAGETLAAWRAAQRPDGPRILRVLAEVLEFLRALHGDGLLAQGLGPGSFWIDGIDRVYFLATDCVVAKKDGFRPPIDRYPSGFAAPEVFADPLAADESSDLFAWAALAYFLLTGESPSKLAADQGERFATFGDRERERLARALEAMPRRAALRAAAVFGATGERFEKSFPGGMAQALMLCLSREPHDRPASVAALCDWLKHAPPSRASAALALRQAGGTTSILVATAGLDPRLGLVVRRVPVGVPVSPHAGAAVYDGPVHAASIADPQTSPATYAIFVKDAAEGTIVYSPPTIAAPVDLARPETLHEYLRVAAGPGGATAGSSFLPLPASLSLLADRPETADVAREMFRSPERYVRGWAVDLLARGLKQPALAAASSKALFEAGLADRAFEVRLASARAIFGGRPDPGLDSVIHVVKALSGDHVDDRIRVARALAHAGLSPAAIEQAVQALEADRVVHCGECKQSMKARELDDHLRREHRYVDVDTELLPLGAALKRLWSRLLRRAVPASAEAIAQALDVHAGGKDALGHALLSQCRSEWLPAQAAKPDDERRRDGQQLAVALGSSPRMARACWTLLAAEEPELRELGRSALLPGVAASLADDADEVAAFRTKALALSRGENLDFAIDLCRRLARAGASQTVATKTVDDLELDREVACPHCGERVAKRTLARHERQAHDRFVFDGRSWARDELLDRLVRTTSTGEARPEGVRLAYELIEEARGADQAPQDLARRLVAVWKTSGDVVDYDEAHSAAGVLAQLPAAETVGAWLLASDSLRAGGVALALIANDAIRLPAKLKDHAVRRLGSGEIDERLRESALATTLRRFDDKKDFQIRYALLSAFVKPAGDKLSQRERLTELRDAIGADAAIQALIVELEETMRIQCPHCREVFSGAEMRKHAQEVHQRVWAGRTLRNPLELAEECLEQYETERNDSLLDAGERYAYLAGGDEGRQRFAKAVLRRCGAVARYLRDIETRAATQKASICHGCFELLPSPRRTASIPVSVDAAGNLRSEFLNIDYTSNLMFREAIISIVDGTWSGQQPHAHLSKAGIVALAAAATVGFLVAAVVVGFVSVPAAFGAVALAMLAATAGGAVAWLYRPRFESALSMAWSRVVPALLAGPTDRRAIEFLAGLALASEGKADPAREGDVQRAARKLLQSVRAGTIPYAQLAPLYRLLIRDQLRNRTTREAALETMTELLQDVARGALPADFLDLATGEGEAFRAFAAAEQLILRWRFVDALRATGSEAPDIDGSEKYGRTLAKVFTLPYPHAENATELAFAVEHPAPQAFRDLGGVSVFQWSQAADRRPFEAWPGIVAASADGQITLRTDGLFFRDQRLDAMPALDIRATKRFVQTGWTYQRQDGGPDLRYKHNPPVGYERVVGYDLIVSGSPHPFDVDPNPVAEKIRRWAHLWFGTIVPRSQTLLRSTTGSPLATLRAVGPSGRVVCRNCGKNQTFVEGHVATAS